MCYPAVPATAWDAKKNNPGSIEGALGVYLLDRLDGL